MVYVCYIFVVAQGVFVLMYAFFVDIIVIVVILHVLLFLLVLGRNALFVAVFLVSAATAAEAKEGYIRHSGGGRNRSNKYGIQNSPSYSHLGRKV